MHGRPRITPALPSQPTLCPLLQVFGAVWSSAMQDKRTSLSKLFNTWTGVFPQPVIDQVAARMVSTSQAAMPAVAPLTMGTTTILVQQPQQAATGYVLASGGAPVQAVVLAPAQQQPQQQFGGYGYSSGGAVAMAPQQPMHMQQPQQQNQLYFGQQQPAAQVPMYAAGPGGGQQQQPGYPPRHQSPMHAGLPSAPPAGPPQYGGSNGYAPVSPPHAWQQQQPPPQVGYSRRSPSPMPPQHQQPQHPGYGGAAHRSPARQQQQPAPAPAQPQMTSQAISSLLASLAKTGVLAAASQAASPEADPALRTTEFSPAFLKVAAPPLMLACMTRLRLLACISPAMHVCLRAACHVLCMFACMHAAAGIPLASGSGLAGPKGGRASGCAGCVSRIARCARRQRSEWGACVAQLAPSTCTLQSVWHILPRPINHLLIQHRCRLAYVCRPRAPQGRRAGVSKFLPACVHLPARVLNGAVCQ